MSSVFRRLKPYYIRKALRYLRHYGVHDFTVRVLERLAPEHVPYGPWLKKHSPSEEELRRQRIEAGAFMAAGREQPLFSVVVPVYRTPERFLREMIGSVLDQSFPDLELVLANASPDDETVNRTLREYEEKDRRVRLITLKENGGISANTNAAIDAAAGEYICLMDHDDLIAPDALFSAFSAIRDREEEDGVRPELLYTDEDKIRDGGKGTEEHFQPHFKPDFNLDLLRSNNYICHFLIVKKSLIGEAGAFDPAFDGAQDYDFVLRCADRIYEKYGAGYGRCAQPGVCHIPGVLYSWRVHPESTADNPDSKAYAYEAGRRALKAHLSRRGVRGEVTLLPDYGFYRVKYGMEERPAVSIIIPSHEQADMLKRCIDAIKNNTDYDNYEVIVVENNSSGRAVLDYYREIQGKDHVRVVRWKGGDFNFSSVCNFGASKASGSYLVFMNNDVEVKRGWLTELLSSCMRPEVGAAGPRLVYPDGRIQSAGIAVGIGGVAGSLFTGMSSSFGGYFHKAVLPQDLSAVTAALMIVRREAYEKAGGFEEKLAVAFNDVDLCLKLREQGYLVLYDPYAEAVHRESLSRGDEYTKEKAERYRREARYMRERWAPYYEKGDPYYNRNLSLKRWDYSLNDE